MKIVATFGALASASLAGLRLLGRPLPRRVPLSDLALLGLATNRLSRLLALDKITRPLRAPFTEVEPGADPDEVKERPRHDAGDTRRAIGELITCPRCTAVWAAGALTCGYLFAPGLTRALGTLLSAAAISDYVNLHFAAARKA